MIEVCCQYLSIWCIWLCVLITYYMAYAFSSESTLCNTCVAYFIMALSNFTHWLNDVRLWTKTKTRIGKSLKLKFVTFIKTAFLHSFLNILRNHKFQFY